MKRISLFFILFTSVSAFAKYNLPRNLDVPSQELVARNFGFGAATKMNLDPSPLGGYDGFQISLSRDFVDVSSLKQIGSGASQENYFSSTTMMVGKGLFYDLDIFFQMTPPQDEDLSSYGTIVRKLFYENQQYDLYLGGLVHASISQFASAFGSNITGYDIYAYTYVRRAILFLGFGKARGIYNYIGNAYTTSSANSEVDISALHTWGGISHEWGRWSAAGTIEDYFDPIYSIKLAYNF